MDFHDNSSDNIDTETRDSAYGRPSGRRYKSSFEDCIYELAYETRLLNQSDKSVYYQFPDGQNIKNIPKLPEGQSYWHNFRKKIMYDEVNTDEVIAALDKRVTKLSDYFSRLGNNELTKDELKKPKPTNFFGPYFPIPEEIEHLSSLDIKIDWELSVWQHTARRGYKFTGRETEYLIERWQQFQKIYKIYDLRPLLGVRCGFYDENRSDIGFVFFRMINKKMFKNFLQYMGKDLPHKAGNQIYVHLKVLCDAFTDGRFDIQRTVSRVTGFEYKFMEEILKCYGYGSWKIMELLIGLRRAERYAVLYWRYIKISHIPIKDGQWSKDEDLQLIKNVCSLLDIKYENSLLTTKLNISWLKIFNNIKTRSPQMMYCHWRSLKQNILTAQSQQQSSSEPLSWTYKDSIKLIEEVYNCSAQTLYDINWYDIAKDFSGYTTFTLYKKFVFLYNSRVPSRLSPYFDEAMEYLYHNVTPVLQQKSYRKLKRHSELEHLLNMESKLSDIDRSSLINYFDEEELQDYDEDIHLLRSLDTSSWEYSDANEPSCSRVDTSCIGQSERERVEATTSDYSEANDRSHRVNAAEKKEYRRLIHEDAFDRHSIKKHRTSKSYSEKNQCKIRSYSNEENDLSDSISVTEIKYNYSSDSDSACQISMSVKRKIRREIKCNSSEDLDSSCSVISDYPVDSCRSNAVRNCQSRKLKKKRKCEIRSYNGATLDPSCSVNNDEAVDRYSSNTDLDCQSSKSEQKRRNEIGSFITEELEQSCSIFADNPVDRYRSTMDFGCHSSKSRQKKRKSKKWCCKSKKLDLSCSIVNDDPVGRKRTNIDPNCLTSKSWKKKRKDEVRSYNNEEMDQSFSISKDEVVGSHKFNADIVRKSRKVRVRRKKKFLLQ